MERCGRAGVFLNSSDEINPNGNRIYVKIRNLSKVSLQQDQESEMYADLYIHDLNDPILKSYSSDIVVEGENKAGDYTNYFKVKLGTEKMILILYQPFVLRSFEYQDRRGAGNKMAVTLAYDCIRNLYHNRNLVTSNLRSGKRSYTGEEFLTVFAHGRIYTNSKQTRKLESNEIALTENYEETELEEKLRSANIASFTPLALMIRQLFLFHQSGVFLGTPILENVKRVGKGYKWDLSQFSMREFTNNGNNVIFINTLICIDICNFLFNNKYFFGEIGIDNLSKLEIWRIKQSSPEEVRSLMVFSPELLLKPEYIKDTVSCIRILKEEYDKLFSSQGDVAFRRMIQEISSIDWGKTTRYLINVQNLKNLFTIAIQAHTEGKPIKKVVKQTDTFGREIYPDIFESVKEKPLQHDSGLVYKDTEAKIQIFFKNIDRYVIFYEKEESGNLKEFIFSSESQKYFYRSRNSMFMDKTFNTPIEFLLESEELILKCKDLNGQLHIISTYKFLGNSQLEVREEQLPPITTPFGGGINPAAAAAPSSIVEIKRPSETSNSVIQITPYQNQSLVQMPVNHPNSAVSNQTPVNQYNPTSRLFQLRSHGNDIQVNTRRGYQRVLFKQELDGRYTLWVRNHDLGASTFEMLITPSNIIPYAVNGAAAGYFSIDQASNNLFFYTFNGSSYQYFRSEPIVIYV
jgi:hypothetical protein